jgi:hypothetical protein
MTREKLAGWSLVVGAVVGMVVMGLHPTGQAIADAAAGATRVALLSSSVHAVAIAGMGMMLYGGVGLTRSMDDARGLASAGLVAFALAVAAGSAAAVASGFVATPLILNLIKADPALRETIKSQLYYTMLVNQACARIYVVAGSAAMVLWSEAGRPTRWLPRWSMVLSWVIALGCSGMALFSDRHLDVALFGGIVVAQSIWLFMAGERLITGGSRQAAGAA